MNGRGLYQPGPRRQLLDAVLKSGLAAAIALVLAATTTTGPAGAAPRPRPASGDVLVLETSVGTLAIRMFPRDAPRTVANLRRLVAAGFYDSLTFHRVVPGFVIQGGDPLSRDDDSFNDGEGGPGYTVPAEIGRPHLRGSVAMARRPDAQNPARESNGSQFTIALRDLPHLDGAYTVFGQVISGWDTVERLVELAKLPGIARRGNEANPGRAATILRARIEPLRAWHQRAPRPAVRDTSRH
jgi:cyclophilin family peptidyl-prolyl cis-trans isomerase